MLLKRQTTNRRRKTRARSPLRLGLAGGGTDLSPYCDRFGGCVLNVTIDRYALASIIPRDDGKVCFEADDIGVSEMFDAGDVNGAKLDLHRGVYKRLIAEFRDGEPLPVTIRTTVDCPPGSGLGSSSTLVVSLVSALGAAIDAPLGNYDIARLAYEIERIDLGLSGGRQDQYAAAFGGLNFIEFIDGQHVIVNPLRASTAVCNELESSIIICFSGYSRESAKIIDRQTDAMSKSDAVALDALHALKRDAIAMKQALLAGDIDGMSEILNSSWKSKQATAKGITNETLETLMSTALSNGALAGKVSGAGGGGFMFFLVHPENRFRLIKALNAAGATASPVKFTFTGSESWQY